MSELETHLYMVATIMWICALHRYHQDRATRRFWCGLAATTTRDDQRTLSLVLAILWLRPRAEKRRQLRDQACKAENRRRRATRATALSTS